MLRIKEILKEKDLLMKDFAELMGVTTQTIGGQIRGKVQLATLEKMAAALDVPLWCLFASPDDVKRDLGIDTSTSAAGGVVEASTTCPHCHQQIKVTFSK